MFGSRAELTGMAWAQREGEAGDGMFLLGQVRGCQELGGFQGRCPVVWMGIGSLITQKVWCCPELMHLESSVENWGLGVSMELCRICLTFPNNWIGLQHQSANIRVS